MFRERHNIECVQCWGMTELGPLSTTRGPKHDQLELSKVELDSVRQTQGRPH